MKKSDLRFLRLQLVIKSTVPSLLLTNVLEVSKLLLQLVDVGPQVSLQQDNVWWLLQVGAPC